MTLTSTRHHSGSAAAICRERGWEVGTRLVGDEGYGPTVIELTAIGEHEVLAKCVAHDGFARTDRETSWVLWCRDWAEIADDDIPKPLPPGTPIAFTHDNQRVVATIISGPDAHSAYIVEATDGRRWTAPAPMFEILL